ncbi:MAG: DMT family transporter [Rhodobiaceae bacterium]|nr:DMT family transporter [Rhodobiaceae bacterium]MCC0055730.1 DMT family transporter [Rhodobiaceae bacterium]
MNLAGIAFKLLSVTFFSLMMVGIKLASGTVPTGQIVFSRSLFGFVPLFAMLAVQGQMVPALKTSKPLGHVWRGFVGGIAMAGSFLSLHYLALHDAVAISYAAPLLAVLLAPFLLNERVGKVRISAVVIGLGGVLLIVSPHLGESLEMSAPIVGAFFALIAALAAAFAMIQVRHLTQSETNASIIFYFSLVTTVGSLFTLPLGWVVPDLREGLLLVGLGLAGGLGQICLTQSYRLAPVSVVAPFDYTSMIFAVAFGVLLFDEVPGPVVLTGAAIVIGAGIFVILRERWLGIQRPRTPGVRSTQI